MAAKVLIAHGDTHSLERAVRDLTVAGFEVVATPDGGDAFARFFEVQPDIVICSEKLPVLDGRSFGNMIRSQAPAIPVVLLVAEQSDEDSTDFLILPEPLDVRSLLALVPDIEPEKEESHDKWGQAPPPAEEPETVNTLHEILRKFQRQDNLLALLDDAGLERLAGLAHLHDHEADDRVINEGDSCDGFYLVVEGAVRVTLAERGGDEVARLGVGEFFGEMALLSEQSRSASVWTVEAAKLLFFEREAVLGLLADYPGLREVLGGVALQRAEENLFQALSGDDSVQSSLSDLLEGIDEDGAATQTESPALSTPVKKLRRPTLPTRPEIASMVTGRKRKLRASLHTLRLYSLRHQFESGLVVGGLGGMAVMATMMALFADGASRARVPVLPPAETAPGDVGTETADAEADGTGENTAAVEAPTVDTAAKHGTKTAGESATAKPDVSSTAKPSGPPPKPRKAMRKHFLELYESRKYASAAGAGKQMQRFFELDWEAEFTLAQAQRKARYDVAALASYLAFAKNFPENVYADDAQFWAAELLAAAGEKQRAAELYKAVIVNPKTNLKQRAEKALANVRP